MTASDEVLAFGFHAVRHALSEGRTEGTLLLQSGRSDRKLLELMNLAEAHGVSRKMVSRTTLDELAGGRHQGVALVGRGRAEAGVDLDSLLDKLEAPPFLLVLDEIQDPHNLGACLRSADAAGVHVVLVPRRRAAGLSPTVRKVAAGAAEHVPLVAVTNLARTLRSLKARGIRVVGAAGDAPAALYDCDLTGPLALVLGNEEKGLRRLTREHCDELVSLPMKGHVESLNVSVTAGICLFEALRQRRT